MRVLVDTNILLRSAQPNHPLCYQATHAVSKLLRQEDSAFFCPQNIAEFWNVATRPADRNGLGFSPEALAQLSFSDPPKRRPPHAAYDDHTHPTKARLPTRQARNGNPHDPRTSPVALQGLVGVNVPSQARLQEHRNLRHTSPHSGGRCEEFDIARFRLT